MPISVSCPVYRNVHDEECLPLLSVLKGCTSLFFSLKWCSPEPKTENVPVITENFRLPSEMTFKRLSIAGGVWSPLVLGACLRAQTVSGIRALCVHSFHTERDPRQPWGTGTESELWATVCWAPPRHVAALGGPTPPLSRSPVLPYI